MSNLESLKGFIKDKKFTRREAIILAASIAGGTVFGRYGIPNTPDNRPATTTPTPAPGLAEAKPTTVPVQTSVPEPTIPKINAAVSPVPTGEVITKVPTVLPTTEPKPTTAPTATLRPEAPFEEDVQARPGEMKIIKKESDEVKIRFGQEKELKLNGISHYPDGHVSFAREGDTLNVFLADQDSTYLLQGKSLETLEFHKRNNGIPVPVMEPQTSVNEVWERDYAGTGSVLKIGNKYYFFYHAEERYTPDSSNNLRASIGIGVSEDGGKTVKNRKQILTGKGAIKPGPEKESFTGNGQPCAVKVNDGKTNYIYLYHTNWQPGKQDGISVARAEVLASGDLGEWKKHVKRDNKNQFIEPGIDGDCDPVIMAPQENIYAALASISYNSNLGKLLAVFETAKGFWSCTSSDGINWGSYQQLMEFPGDENKNWYSYPSLLSLDQSSDTRTSDKGILVYAKKTPTQTSHRLAYRQFVIG